MRVEHAALQGKEALTLTITYAFFSVICGAVFAVLAWIESGPVVAAITYVGVGSITLLGIAFLFSAARLEGGSLLDRQGAAKSGRNRAAS